MAPAARAGAPAAPESAERARRRTCKSAAGDAQGGKFGSGGTRRSRAARGDLRRGVTLWPPRSPHLPLQAWAPSPASSELACTPRTTETRLGERKEVRVRPALDPGLGSDAWTRTWAGERPEPALLTHTKPVLALPRLCDLGLVSFRLPVCLSLPALVPRGCPKRRELRLEAAAELRAASQQPPRGDPRCHPPP